MPAFVQSYFQGQARLMFVTTLGMDASVTSPTSPPYVAKQLTVLFHKQLLCSFLVYGRVVPTTYCTFWLKPSPALEAPGHGHLLGLHGIRSQDLGLPSEYSLGHCGLSAASRHKLAFTSRHYALLTATDTTALY